MACLLAKDEADNEMIKLDEDAVRERLQSHDIKSKRSAVKHLFA